MCRVGAQMLRKITIRHPLSIGEKGQMELLLPWLALEPKFWPILGILLVLFGMFWPRFLHQVPPVHSALTNKKLDNSIGHGSRLWVTAFNTTERDVRDIHPVQHGALVTGHTG